MTSTTPSIKAVLILDSNDGTRVHAKYYSPEFQSNKDTQLVFEKNLFAKTRGQNARVESEIVMLDKTITVFRTGIDVLFCVVGARAENELVLATVLDGLFDAVNGMLRSQLEKRVLLDNLELVILTVDELVDGGHILECDPVAIANRVMMRNAEGDTPMGELTVSQALATAKEQLQRSFR